MDYKNFQKILIEKALAAGFSDCEVYYKGSKHFEVMIMEGEVSDYENSALQGISFRGTWQGRTGYAYTEKLTEPAADYLVAAAKEHAELLSESEWEELYHAGDVYPALEGENKALERLTTEEKILAAKKMEHAALKGEDSIASMDYCVLDTDWMETAIANSYGLSLYHAKNSVTAYVCAIAKDGEEVKTGSHFWKGNDWKQFDPVATGRKAAQIAASHLGAAPIASGKYKVVLDGPVMANFLGVFGGVFFGENIQKGFSMLGGKVGEQIAADCVTLRDDPLLPEGYASTPFDSEGVPCYNKAVVENGVLKTYLYNRKAARKDGVPSTGNGFKAGLTAPIKTAVTNFYLAPGQRSQEELLADMGEGILITDITGLHAGANTVSGDFSLSAEGFLVTDGKLGQAVADRIVGEGAGGFRVTVKERGVRLDIVDGRAVHQVRAGYKEYRTFQTVFPFETDPFQTDAGEPQRVRSEGSARSEYAGMYISSQTGRPDGGRPALVLIGGEAPDEPQVGELFYIPDTVRVFTFAFQCDGRLQRGYEPALPRDPELFRKIRMDMPDGPDGKSVTFLRIVSTFLVHKTASSSLRFLPL